MYVGMVSTLAVGQARYGLMLNENGVLVDDGIVARLGQQRFWVNTTSGGVERTAAAFEEWLQCEFTDFKVAVTSVTSRWANITVAGPSAWRWLEAAGLDPALAPGRMKHMSIAAAQLDGTPLRVLRASFSGELSYEVNLPVDRASDFLERLWVLGSRFDAVAYGIEALQTLRIEKGYIHIGSDTDGTTLPGDVGFGRAVDRKTANFVGRRSLSRPAAHDADRLQLVALAPADGRTRIPVGGQIAPANPPTRTEGHVTSSAISPVLGRPIALAMLKRGFSRTGERVRVHHLGQTRRGRCGDGAIRRSRGTALAWLIVAIRSRWWPHRESRSCLIRACRWRLCAASTPRASSREPCTRGSAYRSPTGFARIPQARMPMESSWLGAARPRLSC